jgi:hypothetical protein
MLVKFYIYQKLQESCILPCVPSMGDMVEFEDDPNIYTVC